MKVTNDEMLFIQKAIKAAKLLGINNIIIEPGKVRGANEGGAVFLYQNTGIPSMSFGSIGLNRINEFNARLELAKSQEKFEADVTTIVGNDNTIGFDVYDKNIHKTEPMWVKVLTMTGKGTKIEYRCANPKTIIAPRKMGGIIQYSLSIIPEVITMLQKGKVAMKGDSVSLISENGIVSLSISDINGDILQYQFTEDAIEVNGNDVNFSFKYNIDVVLSVFKSNPLNTIKLTTKGTIIFDCEGLGLYITPIG